MSVVNYLINSQFVENTDLLRNVQIFFYACCSQKFNKLNIAITAKINSFKISENILGLLMTVSLHDICFKFFIGKLAVTILVYRLEKGVAALDFEKQLVVELHYK